MSWTRICLTVVICLTSFSASAEVFPTRPVTIISPYQPGGTSDIIARVLSQKLSDGWRQPVLVDHRPGANGSIGVMAVVRAPADGYSLLAIASSGLTLNPLIFPTLPYDVDRDLAPIAETGEVANVLIAFPAVPAATVSELIALARAKPKTLAYGSQGIGSNGHVIGEMFRQRAGIEILHVPYKGSAPALNDLVGGQIHFMFDNLPSALPLIQGGKLKAIAVTTATRNVLLPNVPTLAEAGFPDFDVSAWFAVLGSKKMPMDRQAEIERSVLAALKSPDTLDRLAAAGVQVTARGAEALKDRIARETLMWRDVVSKGNIRAQ